MHLETKYPKLSKIQTQSIKEESLTILKRFAGKKANILIAGGSLYETLDQKEIQKIDSSLWTIYYADERLKCKDEEVNYLLSKTFLQHLKAKVVPWAYKEEEENLKFELPKMDLIILGIGPDGHICSLFPNHEELNCKEDIFIIKNSPKMPPMRVSVSLKFLNKQSHLYFFIPKRKIKEFYEEPHEQIMEKLSVPITVFIEK